MLCPAVLRSTAPTRVLPRFVLLLLVALLLPWQTAASAQETDYLPWRSPDRAFSTQTSANLPTSSPDGLVSTRSEVQITTAPDLVPDNGVRYSSGTGEYVTLATMTADSGTISRFIVCFGAISPAQSNVEYDILFYRNSNGMPGSLIQEILGVRPNDPINGDTCVSSEAPGVTGFPVAVPSRRIFIGIRYTTVPRVWVGFDDNGNAMPPSFMRRPGGAWEDAHDGDLRAFTFAVEFDAENTGSNGTCPVQTCTTNSKQVCLSDRFQVTANFKDQGGGTGAMNWDDYRANTGIAYFSDPNNAELVVKVLETCAINNRFWVFAGGLTDQEIDVRICDTQTGVEKQYFNPLKTPFQPVTDTDAFATCP